MKKLLLIPLIVLSGCATHTPEPVVQIQRVEVPVAVHCPIRQNVGPRLTFPDSDAALQAANGIAERVKLIMAGRVLRNARIDRLENAADAC